MDKESKPKIGPKEAEVRRLRELRVARNKMKIDRTIQPKDVKPTRGKKVVAFKKAAKRFIAKRSGRGR